MLEVFGRAKWINTECLPNIVIGEPPLFFGGQVRDGGKVGNGKGPLIGEVISLIRAFVFPPVNTRKRKANCGRLHEFSQGPC